MLEHVHRVEVLLADVVDRPVAGQPQHQHRPGEGDDVAPGDDLLAGGDGVRPDDADHVDVGGGQPGDEQPDVDVRLEPERIRHVLSLHPSYAQARRVSC